MMKFGAASWLVSFSFGLASLQGCGGDNSSGSTTGAGGASSGAGGSGTTGTTASTGNGGSMSTGGTSSTGQTGTTGGTGGTGTTGSGGQGDGMTTFTVTIENISDAYAYPASGVFDTPDGESAPGAAMAGMSYSLEFDAPTGSRLSFATMLVQSNDFFFAPAEDGLALFDENDQPRSGDVTSEVLVWDSGTEANETLGSGPNQAPRQGDANVGPADPDNTVRQAVDADLPGVDELVTVTLDSDGNHFALTIANISDGSSLETPLAPGVFVVHGADAMPLFQDGQPDSGDGLEGLAEDGAPGMLGESLAALTGLVSPLAPGVWALTGSAENLLFTEGQPDLGNGLEGLAEDGMPGTLGESLAGALATGQSGVFDTPQGAADPGAAMPGGAYEFQVVAMPGDYLHFATMLVQTNDYFFAPAGTGLALWDGSNPIDGDITGDVFLWNAGTEQDEPLGIGPNQAPRQSGPNVGPDEGGNVEKVELPAVSDQIRVTISAN